MTSGWYPFIYPEYQNPFCYISDPWHSIEWLWQPLQFWLFGHVALPRLSYSCCLCYWWCYWVKCWAPSQLHLRAWRLGCFWDVWWGIPRALNPVQLGWRHASTWASWASSLCIWGSVGLGHRGFVGISHRGCIVGTSHRGGVMDTNVVGASHRSGVGVPNTNCNVNVGATQHELI